MQKFNLSVYLNTYQDKNPSNSPNLQSFKWNRVIDGQCISNPVSITLDLAPGATQTIFSGVRSTSQDNTTSYSLTPVLDTTTSYSLSYASGTAPNFRTPRATGIDATTQIVVTTNGALTTFTGPVVGLTNATFVGIIGGLTTSVTITVNTPGTAGNSIVLAIDGTSTVSELITAWNSAHPSNTLTLTSGDGTQIPTGGEFTFSGGTNTTPLNVSSVVVGDYVSIGTLFNVRNQGAFKILSTTSNSFSVQNNNGTSEGPIPLTSDFANQIQIYSAAGVQVNDTLVIDAGFSPISQGSYLISAVTANTLTFCTTQLLPTETNINTEIAIYSDAKNLVYVESDQAISITINGSDTATIEPFPGCCGKNEPGIFLRKSTMYSMVLTNNTTNIAKIFVAMIE